MSTEPTSTPIRRCNGAATLARQLAAGQCSAVEVVGAALAGLDRHAALNACTQRFDDAARRKALAADALRATGAALPPLHGVPISVKECLDLDGTPSTFGFPSRRATVATRTEPHLARLLAAGAIPIAKTNVAQMLLLLETDNPIYGRTLHPQDPERSCGGSSGGEAVLVAIGVAGLGIGTDLGGSVRVPAAFCGISALKPTAGRWPDDGRGSYPIGQTTITSQVGLLAPSVADLALGATVLSPELAIPTGLDLGALRIGWYDDDGVLRPCPATRRAVREAAAAFERLGARVRPWKPPELDRVFERFFGVLTADIAGYDALIGGDPLDARLRELFLLGRLPHRINRRLAAVAELFGQVSLASALRCFGRRRVEAYWRLTEDIADYRRRMTALMAADGGEVDLVLSPATALPAVRHGAVRDLGVIGTYTVLWNVLGFPTGVIPWTTVGRDEESDRAAGRDRVLRVAQATERGSAGLPIGVQVAAAPWQEGRLLAALAALQSVAPASTVIAPSGPR